MPRFSPPGPAPESNASSDPDWPEALATVTACRYESRVGRAMAFGMPASRHFRISYHCWAGDAEHTGEFYTEKAMPTGTLFPLRYDPERTASNEYDRHDAPGRFPLLGLGALGTAVTLLLWFALLRGCH